MGKQNVMYTYSGGLFSHKKKVQIHIMTWIDLDKRETRLCYYKLFAVNNVYIYTIRILSFSSININTF